MSIKNQEKNLKEKRATLDLFLVKKKTI